jgi:hypothetical protein
MNTTKLLRFKSFLIALFSVAFPSLAQPQASLDDQELKKRVEQGLAQVYGVSVPFVWKNTKPGDVSSGVEIARTNDALFIDPTPCLSNQQKRILAFVKPYRESKISDAKCDGKSFQQVQVIQQ